MPDHTEEPGAGYDSDDYVVLSVGIEGDDSEVVEVVEQANGEVLEELPFNTLQISVPRMAWSELEQLRSVRAINQEGGLRFE